MNRWPLTGRSAESKCAQRTISHRFSVLRQHIDHASLLLHYALNQQQR